MKKKNRVFTVHKYLNSVHSYRRRVDLAILRGAGYTRVAGEEKVNANRDYLLRG